MSCSERLSLIQEVFQIELMVRLLLPKWFLTCFLYYYFLFYVNLFKELFLLACPSTVCVNNVFVSAVPFSGKRVQRYCFFPNWQNFSGFFFGKCAILEVSLIWIKQEGKKRGQKGISGILLWPGGKTRKISGGNAPDTVANSASIKGKREKGEIARTRRGRIPL